MKTVDLIEEFINAVLKNDSGSFNIKLKDATYHFLQDNVGNAKYIYGEYSYNNDNFYSSLDVDYKLVAIVSNGIVYVTNEYFMNVTKAHGGIPPKYEEYVKLFSNTVDEMNNYAIDTIFPKFYDNLETIKLTDEDSECCERTARKYILSVNKNKTYPSPSPNVLLKEEIVANILCGFTNVDDEASNALNAEIEDWVYRKSINERIKELVKDENIVNTWELAIIDGLRTIPDAKNVNVKFTINGISACEKVAIDVLVRLLTDRRCFDYYNFTTDKAGKDILTKLAGTHHTENVTCECISEITFGKKKIYTKESK